MGERRGVYRERNHLEDLGVDGMMILRWIIMKYGFRFIDWIELVQDMNRWPALVNALMNLRVP
jgi:hypothetical protein